MPKELGNWGNILSALGTLLSPFCTWLLGRPQSQQSYQYGDTPANAKSSPETIHQPIQSNLFWEYI